MQGDTFKALVLEQHDNEVQSSLRDLTRDDLPNEDVLVAVEYSTLNYKDGLALNGKGKIVRSYPMVPGIDFAGTVVEAASGDFQPGDKVILTGWGVGERYWGGYAQMARVKPEWLVKLPNGLTTRQAMAIGTAGFTAMLCVLALEEHGLVPDGREVVVTGATGGVGSVAVAVLAKLGHHVVAATGRTETHDYLRSLGASAIIGRDELGAESSRPLESTRWGGAVDSVGGKVLAGLLRGMAAESSVAACGNAGGIELSTTVLPFILRGVKLLGIESVTVPLPRRREVWERLARDLPSDLLNSMIREVTLEELPETGKQILKGQVQGRVVVNLQQ